MAMADTLVTNADFEKTLDTSDEWIKTRTGIAERRFVSDDQSNESLATQAAKTALEKSGIDIGLVKVLIVATFTPDQKTPSVSCNTAKNLGLSQDIICFDLNAACTGFVYALQTAHSLLSENDGKYALVIGSEVISKSLDMSDRSTAVLFGDGAGAVVIERTSGEHAFVSGYVPDVDNVLYTDKKSGFLQMDGKAVFRFATEKMTYAIQKIFEENDILLDDVSFIIPHQANRRIIDYAQKKCNLDESKIFINLDRYGNTSAASIPIALAEANIPTGKKILCVGFGAGLTYGAVVIET